MSEEPKIESREYIPSWAVELTYGIYSGPKPAYADIKVDVLDKSVTSPQQAIAFAARMFGVDPEKCSAATAKHGTRFLAIEAVPQS